MYEAGTKIDLTYLNKKAVASLPKKSGFETALDNASETTEYQAGTQLTFDKETLSIRRHIRVSFP